jgi:hypothetical protein
MVVICDAVTVEASMDRSVPSSRPARAVVRDGRAGCIRLAVPVPHAGIARRTVGPPVDCSQDKQSTRPIGKRFDVHDRRE